MDLKPSLTRTPHSAAALAFAAEIGPAGPVTPVGGRTQWDVGGAPAPGSREVKAPAGVLEHLPTEMTVRVLAGTTVGDLSAALAEQGQAVALPDDEPTATVGGLLAVGRSGIRRLGWGPVRDAVLEVRMVGAHGRIVTAGGPVVKNVTGYDLCRLFVGSLGTLGILAEVVLRCRPIPRATRWLHMEEGDPFALRNRLRSAASILWDGTATWVLLEGHPDDLDAEAAGTGLVPCGGPPRLPAGGRRSLRPSQLRGLPSIGRFVAEVGVGIVHTEQPVREVTPPDPTTVEIHQRLKGLYDPTGRLNPGRSPQ